MNLTRGYAAALLIFYLFCFYPKSIKTRSDCDVFCRSSAVYSSNIGWICRIYIITEVFMFARFEQFLVSNGSFAPKQIPYYVKRVTECYAACKNPDDKILAADQKKQYLEQLENTREEWQVKQAEQALR